MTENTYHDLKFDKNKPPMYRGLFKYFPKALVGIAQVSDYGFKKYGSWGGWRNVPDARERYMDALLRHLTKHAEGETIDPESGLTHLAHAAWNALAIFELSHEGEENGQL